MKKIKRKEVDGIGFITSDVGSYMYEIVGAQKLAQPGLLPFYTNTRRLLPLRIGEFDIIPHGDQNNFPDELRQVLDEANQTPEILDKKTNLLWGQGPALYRIVFENGIRKKYWDTDPEIEGWLKNWNYEDYLQKTIVEFRHMNSHFSKYVCNRAKRIGGKGFINRLEHVSCVFARLEWNDRLSASKRIIVGDYDQPWKNGLIAFPVWNEKDPFLYETAMRYSNMYTFALDNDYSRPTFFGSLNWIKLESSIPKLLNNYNLNSAALAYHIKVPKLWWDEQEEEFRAKCEKEGKEFTAKLWKDYQESVWEKVTDALSGITRAGKLLTTTTIFDELGNNYVDWVVDPIDKKVKNFIDAQVNISKHASLANTAGLGLHPALSNISADGNLPSGSEQLYAFKLYLMTGVDIPESIVCRDINNAIAANFPGKDLKIGFYHDVVLTEEATSPKDRIKNQGSKPK